ncbi:MAG: UvrD-helicase domain-containing protein [Eubacteriales bacterium]|nr:UvrD-helicase domain-containing protein [Eubacteriales bacterium]
MDLFDQLIMNESGSDTGSGEFAAQEEKSSVSERLLDGLNRQQSQAVQHQDGPLLILAGAGSGKTRVITHRIAWLVQVKHVRPSSILAITFTNKAAAEMKSRIEALVGHVSSSMWIGTFHSMLLRILRRYAERLGYTSHFTILDSDDQQRIIKQCYKELSIDDKKFPVRMVHSRISTAKNALTGVEQFAREAGSDFVQEKVAQVYKLYQQILKQNNSMDFDDILFEAVRLLENNEDVLADYQNRFNYILVDEYQDTNHAQYKLVHLLSAVHKNLCVVGDDDQSIYSFRGANIQNILDFEKDFKNCTVIKLEQNYRSTNNVLQAANAVIKNNRGRKSKQLRTELPDGDLITFYRSGDHSEEARFVAREIVRCAEKSTHEQPYGQIAILYRLNALSRNLESALREQGIPYRIFGGTRFYDRKEIRDVLAYLRLILIPEDRLSFARIINTPRRGIGDATVAAVDAISAQTGMAPLEVCAKSDRYPELARASGRLLLFSEMIADFRKKMLADSLTLAELIEAVENDTGLIQEIIDQQEKSSVSDSVDRIENLKELLSDAVEFNSSYIEQLKNVRENPDIAAAEDLENADETLPSVLTSYLERATLYAEMDDDKDQDYVRLMTIHSAKGLEFDTVFLIGAEEGLFPGYRSLESEAAIEEERRLAYVAITRARQKLYISTARSRLIFGQTQAFRVSQFVMEIPAEYLEEIGGSRESRAASHEAYANHSNQPAGRARIQFPGGPAPAAGGRSSTNGFGNYTGSGSATGNNSGSGRFGQSGQMSPVASYTNSKPTADKKQGIDPSTLKRGDKVKHQKFGVGRIEQITPVANDAILVIEFEKQGIKRLMAKMAPLTKV